MKFVLPAALIVCTAIVSLLQAWPPHTPTLDFEGVIWIAILECVACAASYEAGRKP